MKFVSSFCNTTKMQRIIGIVEGLRLPARHCFAQALAGGRSSKRLTVYVIRNRQRNPMTLDGTNIALPQSMEYDFSSLARPRPMPKAMADGVRSSPLRRMDRFEAKLR
ncbi:MAG: hypothetical protein JRF50_08555 [Deltaproteobacteria bacterium]|nr:hypothetical protein [Deltaproteobacteria bacterium]